MGQTQITQSHVIVVFGLDSKLCTTCHICDYPSSEEPDDCGEGWEPRRHILSQLFRSCGITYVPCALRPETWTGISSTPPGKSRATFDAVLAAVSGLGRVQVLAEKTRIALHVRMSFAAFIPRRRWHPLASALLIYASDTTRASFSGARSLTETRRPAHKDHSGAAWRGSAGQPGWRHIGGSASGYQLALRVVGRLAVAVTGQRTSDPPTVYLCIGALGANVRICRAAGVS